MAIMDFPASPTVGDLYPDPPVTGVPQYRWDGSVWLAVAPPEGLVYVKRAGDVMTGFLTLHEQPTADMHAVPKSYAVSKSGDTMTGDLAITKSAANLDLNSTSIANPTLTGTMVGKKTWQVGLGWGPLGDFAITSHDDTGLSNRIPLHISRSDGLVSIEILRALSGVEVGPEAVGPAFVDFHSSGNSDYDARIISTAGSAATPGQADLSIVSYNLNCTAYRTRFGNGGSGPEKTAVTLHGGNPNSGGGSYISFNNDTWFVGQRSAIYGQASNSFLIHNGTGSGGQIDAFYIDGGTSDANIAGTTLTKAIKCKRGAAGAFGGNSYHYYWTGGAMEMWVDSTNLGNVSVVSDYRIKKDVIDLPSTWDAVKALRPIKYTQAEFTTPSQMQSNLDEARHAKEHNLEPKTHAPTFVADNIERWGFIAHELQEKLIENAATGVKDSPDTVQSPNPWTIIAALTRTVQEMQARIEALEAT